ncbi:M13 family metallopeptidase [Shewanella intestini]|uniref:Peptidase M13 n=1 Tax=Shewanella intestini TaxID=2017544 RepID=A0ABS5I5G8_9GAMM|nr:MULTISPECIES: M13-type metalloendopeptidase [Shewanella]MBR9729156.1 peptidase M13 [Shewanella intestini]MRG37273.1 peptidase M13 [Shewanella sp. XMDDZSB0408]
MNKFIVGGLCASVILGLSACNSDTAIPNTAPLAKNKAAVAVQQQLSSGIDFTNFDKNVRPQDDFYSYVNGAWINKATIPNDRTRTGAFSDLNEKSYRDVKHIIDTLAATPNLTPGSNEQKVADLYRSYMDVDTLNQLGVTPIKGELNAIAAIKNKADLATYFGHSQVQGDGSPLTFYVEVDFKDANRYSAFLTQSGLSLPEKDYYFNKQPRFESIRKAFVTHVENMYSLAGFAEPKASAQKIMTLETAMAKQNWSIVENRNIEKSYNAYTVKDLAKLAPNIDWKKYLTALGLGEKKTIILNQPSYVKGLSDLIANTDLDTWKTYLQWQVLNHAATKLTPAIDQANFEFYSKKMRGQDTITPRWKRGVALVNSVLGEAVGQEYVQQQFKPESKKRMQQLVENLRNAYVDSVDDLEWMSDVTKAATKKKLAKFTPKVGYPERWENYDQLTIKGNELFANSKRANAFRHKKELERLAGPIRKWEWDMTPQTVNAYYNPVQNEIVFPAAILQAPFFNPNADDAVNYGGIGAVIGHEMGHGFDDQGAKFDGDGNMRDWWTKQDFKEFSARAKQLVEQFDGYAVFDDLNVNGKLTLGENIGDLSGVTIAYRAYKKSLHGKPAPVIDGLTGDQRFFIGFTQIWRSKIKEASLRNQVATDPHSPEKFRTLGPLSNTPAFYKAFNVKPGDAMYVAPEKRVKIW